MEGVYIREECNDTSLTIMVISFEWTLCFMKTLLLPNITIQKEKNENNRKFKEKATTGNANMKGYARESL